jgi:prepilin-type processing-associated H-X9-DG protein
MKAEGAFFCLYADTQRIVARAKELATQIHGSLPPEVDKVLEQLGITAVRSKYLHVERREGVRRMGGFAHVTGKWQGLLKIWDQKALADDDLKVIPRAATWAHVTRLDLAALWEETTRILEELSPDAAMKVQGGVAASAQVLGFSVIDDLLPALGDTWAVYDAPENGGLLITGTVLSVSTRDADKLQGILQRLVEMGRGLAGQANSKINVTLMQTEYGGHTIHYVVAAGLPVPVTPAWGFAGGRWVLGLTPQTVAVALQQADPKTRKDSVLDRPDVQAARKGLPQPVEAFTYMDSQKFARLAYPLMNAWRTMLYSTAAEKLGPLDLKLMPPVNEATEKVRNLVAVCQRDPDGIVYASIGDGAPVPLVVGGAALALGAVRATVSPALDRAQEQGKSAKELAQLKDVGIACLMYADKHDGHFPPDLDVLIDEGALTPNALHSPRDSEDEEISYTYIPGLTVESKSPTRTVVAYGRIFTGGKASVLFGDGHAERMPVGRFRELLIETYKQLGREPKVPLGLDSD